MVGGMDSFIVMFTAKRVISFRPDYATTCPFGSHGGSFGVEVDTDDAIPFAFGRSLRFAEFAGLNNGFSDGKLCAYIAMPFPPSSRIAMRMLRSNLWRVVHSILPFAGQLSFCDECLFRSR